MLEYYMSIKATSSMKNKLHICIHELVKSLSITSLEFNTKGFSSAG